MKIEFYLFFSSFILFLYFFFSSGGASPPDPHMGGFAPLTPPIMLRPLDPRPPPKSYYQEPYK